MAGGLIGMRGAGAQVIALQVGGDSHADGVATVARFWGRGYDGWVGIGHQQGARLGGFVRFDFGREVLRVGNDFVSLDYPTDVFSLGHFVAFQGATWLRERRRGTTSFFVGTNAIGLGSPLFSTQRAGRGLAGIVVRDSLAPHLSYSGRLLLATRQSFTNGIEWRAAPRTTLATTVGFGANRPFAVGSMARLRALYELRASVTATGAGYRRVYLHEVAQSRLDGLAFELRVNAGPHVDLSVSRQTFVRDSTLGSRPSRATGTSVVATATRGTLHAAVAASTAESERRTDHSGYAAVGSGLGQHATVDLYLLVVHPKDRRAVATPIVAFREVISPRLSVEQVLTIGDDHQTLTVGGSWLGTLSDFNVGYQVVHSPFLLDSPFLRTLYVAARFNIGAYAAHVTTTLLPSGETRYSASLATYLYPGGSDARQPTLVTASIPKYVVRGRVVDESGEAVRGAALTIGAVPLFTDRAGHFFMRANSRRPLALVVELDAFTVAGRYEVVSAPPTVTPTTDAAAEVVGIVVRKRP